MTDVQRDPDAPAAKASVQKLGYAPMDDLHEEFEELLTRSERCDASTWLLVLQEIDGHLRTHFEAGAGSTYAASVGGRN